jgi:hypothetical protein
VQVSHIQHLLSKRQQALCTATDEHKHAHMIHASCESLAHLLLHPLSKHAVKKRVLLQKQQQAQLSCSVVHLLLC